MGESENQHSELKAQSLNSGTWGGGALRAPRIQKVGLDRRRLLMLRECYREVNHLAQITETDVIGGKLCV